MKKQIFILVMMFFAISIGSAFGQTAAHVSDPRTLVCTGTALNPIAGRSYDYSSVFNPTGGVAYWYATRSTDIVTGSARAATVEAIAGSVVSAATNYGAPTAAVGVSSTAAITWNSAVISTVAPATPLLVVVEYDAPSGGCANNLKVFNIVPKNAFTVDIRSMLFDGTGPAAYDATTEQCADKVKSAKYNTTNFKMDMDYGVQTLYFEVIAANFNVSFIPSYKLSGLDAGGLQTAEIFWGTTAATATTSLGAALNGATVNGTAATTAVTDTKDGVSIFVKVVIQNKNVENLAGETITLAVDAKNAAGLDDVKEADCTLNTAFADAASQIIKLRPTATPTAPLTAIGQN